MIGDDIAAALPGLRAQAESRMTDAVVVGEYASTTDSTTGDLIRTLVVERYTGVGRVRWGSRDVTSADAPSMPVAVQEPYLSIPFGSTRLMVADEVLVTGSADPVVVDRRFVVAGAPVAGQVTAHRYPLKELT